MPEYPVTAHFNMPVDHHVFSLTEDGERPQIPEYANAILALAPGFAAVNTGIAMGDVRLTVEVHQQPPTLDIDEWEEAVEVTLEATAGRIKVAAVDDSDPTPPFPVLTPNGPGYYRVRVHARGRDTAIDLAVDEPVEDYLIQTWPAPPRPQKIYKQTDRYGSRWVLSAGKGTNDHYRD
ncbi:hypothetical protein BKA00_005062 [Actinomadura coerulea]|uniref:Uncharacterized protein n=1 Tax=Actinomadura coerulea TaxID=46159 RepID=A0A7X0L125_9ACTN|nr:hypothetical protein [Actinomadura coerulea]MBB6398148.1 hypothetical protein [Actinomadura coerulea]